MFIEKEDLRSQFESVREEKAKLSKVRIMASYPCHLPLPSLATSNKAEKGPGDVRG